MHVLDLSNPHAQVLGYTRESKCPERGACLGVQARRVAKQRLERAHMRACSRMVQRIAALRIVHRQCIRTQRQQVRHALRMPAWRHAVSVPSTVFHIQDSSGIQKEDELQFVVFDAASVQTSP